MKMNVKLNPAIKIALAAAVLLVGAWLLSRRFQIEVGLVDTPTETVPVIKTSPSQGETQKRLPESDDREEAVPPIKPDPAMVAARRGSLRVSNRSDHPVRVALLSKQKNTDPKSGETSAYDSPAHWDFSPGEGSSDGLVVSLPDRKITIKRGDVVVAFAQDGSQRYWGPYVVGETDLPTWSRQKGSWELILEQ